MSLGDRLRSWREKRGFTQEELAQKSGITQGMIYKIEKGIANPSLPVITRIAETLNIPISFLIEPNIDFGDIIEFKEILNELDDETREFLNITNKDYIVLAKDIKKSDISIGEIKAALEIIKKYKQGKNA